MVLGNPFVRAGVLIALAPALAGPASELGAGAGLGVSHPALALAVVLPFRADAATLIEERETNMRASFTLMDARPAAPSVRDGTVVYRGGAPSGGDLEYRVDSTGAEDFVRFGHKPKREEIRYRVDVRGAKGLRLVENILELLDAAGVPRLRMAAPYVVDRTGLHDARVTLEDCAADRDPRGPWGRSVTAPGRAECTVRVAWGDGAGAEPVVYPAVVDPAWSATKGTMTEPRRGHTATLLASGKVLIAGGEATALGTTTYKKTAELFDPVTATFAATTSMTDGRSFHAALRLSTNNVIVVGGNSGAAAVLGSTEVYDVTTSKFRTVGGLTVARARSAITSFGITQALVAGGEDGAGTVLDSAEVFDDTGVTWTVVARMTAKRVGHYLTTLPTGQPLVVGGTTALTLGDLAACERFAAGAWTSAPGLGEARHDFAGTTFTAGEILVAGGFQGSVGKVLATAELFDSIQGKWIAAGTLKVARTNHTLTALPSGAAVAAGGVVRDITGKITSYLKSTELFDPASNAWTALPDLTVARSLHTATLLADGRVLIAGGDGPAGALGSAEILTLDPDGTTCTLAGTCASGFCADGVCCKTLCDGACSACALTSTGKPSGTCAPVLAGKDPRNDCTDDGAPACTKDGLCDGKGACQSYAAAAPSCTAAACKAGSDCTSGFCSDGICCDTACSGKCETCTALKKGSGTDGACGPTKAGTDPDAECGKLGTGTCSGDGLCDGTGGCRVPAAGKACAPAACIDSETLGAPATCSAVGDCTPVATSCIPYQCDTKAVKCKTTCTGDTDCATGAHCIAGACQRNAIGAACSAATDCTSTSCVDGICCDKPCTGQCEACDLTGSEGTCGPATGPPHGDRPACTGDAPCSGHCNGVFAAACVYPLTETECGTTTTCEDGNETSDRCNGLGDCVPTPKACTPFACGTGSCNTDCTKDADCADGYNCSKGTCVLPSATSCADGGVKGEDGGPCTYPGKGGDSGGCGCRSAPSSTPHGNSTAALLVLALGAVCRRKRVRNAPRTER